MKVLIYIVCYNAEKHIYNVLKRIPPEYHEDPTIEIIISDDCSSDDTAEVALQACKELGFKNYQVFKTKVNQGYGGNQKIGYNYACNNGFDYVILLHGDGQYAPEEIPNFLKLMREEADVILGSRMLIKKNTLKGKMPVIRFISNILLTKTQNLLAQMQLSEFHTGYRAYSTKFLKKIPFELNSNGFDFDTDILLQARFLEQSVKEFPISTNYGTEKCNVKLLKYGIDILKTTLRFRLQQLGIGCLLKFRGSKNLIYKNKFGFKFSTHYSLLKTIKALKPKRILEIGSGAGYLGNVLAGSGIMITGIDLFPPQNNCYKEVYCRDIEEFNWGELNGEQFDLVCLMDTLEHLREPESLLIKLRSHPLLENALFIISVPNIAFVSVRIGLLLGRFSYSDRGILDIEHRRLFTYRSFHAMLKECGFKINKTISVPPPFKLIHKSILADIFTVVFTMLNKLLPGLFSFQIIKIATPIPTSFIVYNRYLQKYS